MQTELNFYRQLSHLPWPQTYRGKFLLMAFLGVHLPLIALVVYTAVQLHDWSAALPFLLVTLIATLIGTIITMVIQGKLLAPLLQTSRALDRYVRDRTLPDLPKEFTDEAGLLMNNAQSCIGYLDELLRLKNNLLAVLSHDARSPISSIILAGSISRDLLNEPEIDLEELRYMNAQIMTAAERQSALMNNIMTLARSDTKTITVERRNVPLMDILRVAEENARLRADRKRINLQLLPPSSGENATAELDVAKVEQILNNLVANAIKFTPSGGTVRIGAEADGEWVEFRVQDTGIGMSDEVLSQLFAPFTRSQRPGTDQEQGSGLGLWICKTFTELHDGSITVESRPNEGSLFRVRLPKQSRAEREKEKDHRNVLEY